MSAEMSKVKEKNWTKSQKQDFTQRILKKVFNPNCFLKGATDFKAGWKSGAWMKQIFPFSKSAFKSSELSLNLYPNSSNTFDEPEIDDAP